MTAYARNTDPDTSHEAAESLTPRVTDLEARVLATLARLGPSTTHQIAAHTGLDLVTISPRMKPLLNKRRVTTCGVDRTNGRPRTVYALVPERRAA